MKDRHENERIMRQKRKSDFLICLEQCEPNDDGLHKIPVKELLDVLGFKEEKALEDWLHNHNDFIIFIVDDFAVVTQME